MRTRGLTLLISIVVLAASHWAQPAKEKAELRSLLDEFLAGAGRNDVAVHDRFWAQDLIYTRSAGSRITKEELMKGVRTAPAPKPEDPVTVYSAEDVQIRTYGNTAVVAFKLVGKTTRNDGSFEVSQYLNTGTFVKRNGRWQAVAWQATMVPKPIPQTETVGTKAAEQPAAAKPASVPGRTYVRGPRGGCYYLNASGKKIYVNKELCS